MRPQARNEKCIAAFAKMSLDGDAIGFEVDAAANLACGRYVKTREIRGVVAKQMSSSPEMGHTENSVIFTGKFFFLFAARVETLLGHYRGGGVGDGENWRGWVSEITM